MKHNQQLAQLKYWAPAVFLHLRPHIQKQRAGEDACWQAHPRCSTFWSGPCSRSNELDSASAANLHRALQQIGVDPNA